MDASAFFASTRARVSRLGSARARLVAMACAQRLAQAEGDADPGIAAALSAGWAVEVDPTAVNRLTADLERRPDADDDKVAAAIFAVRAACGSLDDAQWAVGRFVDAAFDRGAPREPAYLFGPIDEQAAQPSVRSEIEWLDATLVRAEATIEIRALALQLRSS